MNEPVTHYLCIHCERAFPASQCRHLMLLNTEIPCCAHDDCDGTWGDLFQWSNVRWGREDRYPVVPVPGRVYPLYDDVVGRWLKSRRNPDRCDGAGCDNHVGKGAGWVFRFDCGLEYCRQCAEGTTGTLTVDAGKPLRYVIGSPPAG